MFIDYNIALIIYFQASIANSLPSLTSILSDEPGSSIDSDVVELLHWVLNTKHFYLKSCNKELVRYMGNSISYLIHFLHKNNGYNYSFILAHFFVRQHLSRNMQQRTGMIHGQQYIVFNSFPTKNNGYNYSFILAHFFVRQHLSRNRTVSDHVDVATRMPLIRYLLASTLFILKIDHMIESDCTLVCLINVSCQI